MTPTLVSLLGLTLGFTLMVLWVWSPRTRQRWEEASRLPFNQATATQSCEGHDHD